MSELNKTLNMLLIAINLKPKDRKRTVETRAETLEIITKMDNEIQGDLDQYECLKRAVMQHKDSESIIGDAKKMFEDIVKGE